MINLNETYRTHFDKDLILGIKEKPKLCLGVQKFLDDFIDSFLLKETVFKGITDPSERKIVHKIADRYGVTRKFVDKNSGDIILSKQAHSRRPDTNLTTYFSHYLAYKKELKSSRRVLKIADPTAQTSNDFPSKNSSHKELSEKYEELTHEERKLKYEEAKKLIFLDYEEQGEKSETSQVLTKKPGSSSRLNINSKDFDPDFIRPSETAFFPPNKR